MKEKALMIRNLFFILLAGVMISACDKDEDDPKDDLVGTWTSGTSTIDAKIGSLTMTQYFIDSLGLSQSDAQIYTNLFNVNVQQAYAGTITFNADKTYTATLGGETDQGTWIMSADKKQLTLDSTQDPPIVLNVDRLTANQLDLSWTETGSEDVNDDNRPEAITVNVKMSFSKL